VTLPARGRVSLFIQEIPGLDTVPADFRGVLRVVSDVSISVIGIRGQNNERAEFLISTMPALAEETAVAASEWIIPHIVNGDGYTTEFFVFSLSGSVNGSVTFSSHSGGAINLPIIASAGPRKTMGSVVRALETGFRNRCPGLRTLRRSGSSHGNGPSARRNAKDPGLSRTPLKAPTCSCPQIPIKKPPPPALAEEDGISDYSEMRVTESLQSV
jgi:hypothetical protein